MAKHQALAGWLYRVCYRIALESKAINDRRKKREKQVRDLPHPVVVPVEPPDWRPWLDLELNRLPEKYRTPIILCDLEGRTRKDAARQLKVPEGTLSSRLATGRRMLAKRMSRYGLSLAGGALSSLLSEGAASALPAPLASATVKIAVLVAAGELTAISTSVGILVKGAFQTMLLAKLKLAVGTVIVVMALGASGLAYRLSAQSVHPYAPAEKAQTENDGKPASELEALRKENELLKLNLRVLLEKMHAQEAELRGLKTTHAVFSPDGQRLVIRNPAGQHVWVWNVRTGKQIRLSGEQQIGKNFHDPKELRRDELQRAVDALEKAVKDLREQLKKQEGKPGGR